MGAEGLGLVAGLLGGGASLIEGQKGRDAASDAAKKALEQYNGLNAPTLEEQKLVFEMLASQGQLTPEMLQSLNLSPSQMQNTFADQGTIDTQKQSLDQLSQLGKSGLSEGDMAAARQIERQTANSDMARRKSILDSMAQRGVSGSGAELAAQLDNVQKAEQAQADANDRLLQEAQTRQLQALSQTGQLSGQVRAQDFGEKSQRSQAADAINKFNVMNQQQNNNQNVANANDAMKYNLANNQRIADTNVGLKNSEQTNNKGLYQSQFNNNLNLANAKAGRNMAIGDTAQKNANAVATGIAGIASGVSNLYGASGNKKDPNDINIDQEDNDWLNS